MFTRMTSAKKLGSFMLAGFLLLLLSANGNACRMYAAIGYDLPDGLLSADLVTEPNSLFNLSSWNQSGWGICYYPDVGDFPLIARGQPAARNDSQFTATVDAINSSKPQITLAHIRLATSGCMGVPDPHPFYRDRMGKTWLFEHNGNANKDNLINLLGSWLDDPENWPNGSDIPACEYPPMTNVVGSEIYFLYLIKNIEENGGNTVSGIAAGVRAMISNSTGSINFILSDGETIWAFRRGVDTSHALYYLYDSNAEYAAVASQPPSASQGSWNPMSEYQLIVLRPGAAPVFVNDVRTYYPGDFVHNGQVDSADLEAFANYFGQGGGGDLDFDGDADGADLAAVVAVYGITYP